MFLYPNRLTSSICFMTQDNAWKWDLAWTPAPSMASLFAPAELRYWKQRRRKTVLMHINTTTQFVHLIYKQKQATVNDGSSSKHTKSIPGANQYLSIRGKVSGTRK